MAEKSEEKIIYPLVKAYLTKAYDISIYQLAKKIDMRCTTLRRKLTGKNRLYLDECILIRDYLDPEIELEKLFQTN